MYYYKFTLSTDIVYLVHLTIPEHESCNIVTNRLAFLLIFTARKRICEGYAFTPVCQSFCSQGGLPQCMLGYPPQKQTPLEADIPREVDPPKQTPPWKQTPQSRHPPKADPSPAQCMLEDTVNKRAVCILLECNLVKLMIPSLVTFDHMQSFL